MTEALPTIADWPVPLIGLLASFLAGTMSGVGALGVFLVGARSRRSEVLLLGFSAGIMLAATSFSLIVPGIEAALARGAGS